MSQAATLFSEYNTKADALLAQMTLDEKIGQMVRVDSSALTDKTDVKKYFFGSALSGGSPDSKTERGPHGIGSEKKVAKGGSYKTDVLGHMRINYHYQWLLAATASENGFRCVRPAE